MEKVFESNKESSKGKNTVALENNFKNNKKWIERVCLYGGISIFILLIFAVAYAIYGVYPFGNATVSSYDMSAQVAPFIEHFFDVFNGKSSLFYTYSIAGGADVFGTLAYCCISPFTFIFLLFGEGNVYYGTGIVLPLKIVCVAISALYYVRKRFPEISPIIQVVLSLSYAFCGYLFVSNTYINWVDLLIYLPFVEIGFNKLVKTGKKISFVIPLACMIYTCFSISCFALFTIYPIIVLYVHFCVEKENRKKVMVNAVWGLVLTIAVSLPLLVPALKAFLVSGRKTSIFDNIMASYSYEALYKKVSYIFTDAVTLFLTLAYFVKKGIKGKKEKFLALAGVILLVPILIDESMNLLNMGSYMSYSLRFGFLTSFYLLYVSCLLLSESATDKELENNTDVVTGKRAILMKVIPIITLSLLTVGFIVGLLFFYKALEDQTFVQWFAARFAHSEGGLETTSILFGCIALIALLGILFVYKCKLSIKFFTVILAILTCCQSVFYSFNLVSGNYYEPYSFDQIGAITDYVEELEGNDNTRVKMNGDYLTACMPFTLHTNAYSVFSSVIDNRNFIPPNFFGYSGNGKNSMKSYGGKYMGDVIFGNKYFITEGDYYRYYLEEISLEDLKDENGEPIDIGDYKLYKNQYALPHAFAVDNAKTLLEGGIESDYDSILKMLGGENYGIEWMDSTVISQPEENVFRLRITVVGAGNYYLLTDFENPTEIKYTRSAYKEEDAVDIPTSQEISLGYAASSSGAFSVYFKSSGEPLTEEDIKDHFKVFKIANAQLEKICGIANAQNVEFNAEPNLLTAKLTAEEGQYLFMNYVALPGHTAYVNGKEKPLEENTLGFILVELDEGSNLVEIRYKSPYISLIGLGAVLCLAIVGIYLLLKLKAKNLMNKLNGVIYWMAVSLGAVILLFFFVMPILVCAYKNVKLLIETIIKFFANL